MSMTCSHCGWEGPDNHAERLCPKCYHPLWTWKHGDTVGPYRLERLLGAGSFAEVWLATHQMLGIPRALKRLRIEELLLHWTPKVLEDFKKRFVREAQIQAKLLHENIVHVLELSEWAGEIWMIMEYCEGGTLQEYLRSRKIPLSESLQIVKQMLAGLDFAHRHGVVHRDIKPSNILKTQRVWKIADFGIAKAMDSLHLTQTGSRMGTPYYMAPEQWKDPSRVGPASDIYSVGCILYELVAGHVPFGGNTLPEVMQGHLQKPPPEIPDAPRWLVRIIERALAKDPNDRFESAGEFLDALHEFTGRLSATVPLQKPRPAVKMHVRSLGAEQIHTSWVTGVDVHEAQPIIATVGNDGWVRFWDRERRQVVEPAIHMPAGLFRVYFTPGGHGIVVIDLEGSLYWYGYPDGRQVKHTLRLQPPTAAAVSAHRFHLLLGSSRGVVEMWDLRLRVRITEVTVHSRSIVSMDFAPDGYRWASIDQGGHLLIWDLRTGQPFRETQLPRGVPLTMIWHQNGCEILIGAQDGEIVSYDIEKDRWAVHAALNVPVRAMWADPQGEYLYILNAQGDLLLCDLETYQILDQKPLHTGTILTYTYVPERGELYVGTATGHLFLFAIGLATESRASTSDSLASRQTLDSSPDLPAKPQSETVS